MTKNNIEPETLFTNGKLDQWKKAGAAFFLEADWQKGAVGEPFLATWFSRVSHALLLVRLEFHRSKIPLIFLSFATKDLK